MSRPRTGSTRRQSRTTAASAARDTSGPRTLSARDVTLVVATILALVGATVTFLALRDGQDARPGRGPTSGAQLKHVHGLGLDPAGDMLVVGSHHGLFRLQDNGQVSLIGGHVQDFMGFAVVGPHHYVASGHPAEGQPGPSSLGLIESTDGGQSWQSVSLSGQADFHALEARHGLLYGYNSLTGALMVSDDKKHWHTRAQLPMADFAVSPEDPDVVLATTEQGLARSEDGGRTFQLVNGAPLLLLLSWANDGTVVGVQPDGVIQVSQDVARTWQRRGRLAGPPEALEAVSGQQVFAAAGGKVLVSTNGGRSFDSR
jgi:photosystem II stability/assembly factor-like uncharacterized protein